MANQKIAYALFLSCAFAAVLLVVASAKPPDKAVGNSRQAKWTVLVYLALDNDLDRHMLANVNEMESVGGSRDIRVVAQLDTWRRRVHGSTTAKRLLIAKDIQPQEITSPVVEDLGEVDMTDPKVMSDFVIWGVKNYPADRYFLVLADHGCGSKGFCQDYTNKSKKYHMPLGDLFAALTRASKETGIGKFNLIGFDACVMAVLEVDFILQDFACYRVASEDAGPIVTWPYDRILNALTRRPDMSARELGRNVCEAYLEQLGGEEVPENLTLSLVDMSKLGHVVDSANKYALSVVNAIDSQKALAQGFVQSLRNLRKFAREGDHYSSVDLKHVTSVFGEVLSSQELGSAGELLARAIDQAVVCQVKKQGLHVCGIGIRLPRVSAVWKKDRESYRHLPFAKATRWHDMIDSLHGFSQHSEQDGLER